jgi:tetratricopeptide (TPR) repeat protein
MIAVTMMMAALAAAETPQELNNQGAALYRQANYSEAERSYEAALSEWRLRSGSERDQAVTLNNLAVLYRATGRLREARAAHQEAVRQLREVEGNRGMGVAMALANLADTERLLGDPRKAASTAREALDIYRAAGLLGSPAATAMQVLASAEIEQRRFGDARELLQQALAIRERELGPTHSLTGSVWSSLATLAMEMGDYGAAETVARQALAIARASQGERRPATATCRNNLAQALRFQGRYAEAEPLYREAIAIWEETLGREHPDTARGVANLGGMWHDRGRESGAEALYVRAHTTFSRTLGPRHPLTLATAAALADVYRAQRRLTEAGKVWRAVLPAMEETMAAGDPRLESARAAYAQLAAGTQSHTRSAARNTVLSARAQ